MFLAGHLDSIIPISSRERRDRKRERGLPFGLRCYFLQFPFLSHGWSRLQVEKYLENHPGAKRKCENDDDTKRRSTSQQQQVCDNSTSDWISVASGIFLKQTSQTTVARLWKWNVIRWTSIFCLFIIVRVQVKKYLENHPGPKRKCENDDDDAKR